MGERKVQSKYYPPDFPSKLPGRRKPTTKQPKVQNMLPLTIRCITCGTFMSKGTKVNSPKEQVVGETYLGLLIFRFRFKCSNCSAEITFKTDPRNSDYVVESGATRRFEPWRDEDKEAERRKRKREAEEFGDSMKVLENRSLDSKREMDAIAALHEALWMKKRHESVSVDAMLGDLKRRDAEAKEEKRKREEEEDEALVKSVFRKSKNYVRRIDDDDDDDEEDNGLDDNGSNLRKERPRKLLPKTGVSFAPEFVNKRAMKAS